MSGDPVNWRTDRGRRVVTGFSIELAELRATQATASQLAGELRSKEGELAASMADFLGAGWQGAAAAAFGQSWEQWQSGVRLVLDGLDKTAALLGASEQSYQDGDQQAAGSLTQLEGQL